MDVFSCLILYYETVLCLVFLQFVNVHPRVISTRYGECKGMIIPLGSRLQPVEVYSGFQFASTKGFKMRYMPPTGSLEKWLSVRIFSNRSFRGVCPQVIKPNEFVHNRIRNIEPYVLQTSEQCLNLNLHVPVKG